LNFFRLSGRAARATAIAALACATLLPTVVNADPSDRPMPGEGASSPDGEQSTFEYFFDRKSIFKEEKVDTLPPLPNNDDLLPFEVSKQTSLVFAIDPKSISIGKEDHVIRYTVVITSPSGARNVRYEGLRCDAGERWRMYAAVDEDGTGWDRDTNTDWDAVEENQFNAYHAALAHDYLCYFQTPYGTAKSMAQNIRYKRTISDLTNR
jgi:CNP1-like family